MGSAIAAAVSFLVAVALGVVVVWWARSLWRRRLDRDPHHTALQGLGAAGVLVGALWAVAFALGYLGLSAATHVLTVSLVFLVATVLVVAGASAVIEVRQIRDRRAAVRSARQLGEKVPRSLYRRRPRSPTVIVALYLGAPGRDCCS